MVIQSNMSPKAIVEVWGNTAIIFENQNVPLIEKSLESFLDADSLMSLLIELNEMVGSSTATCIDGG